MMRLKPISKDAVDLFLNGTLTLAKIECNGIRIDADYLAGVMQRVVAEIADLEKRMWHSKEWCVWQRMHGVKANLTSRQQLGEVLFGNVVKGKENIFKQGNLGYECNEFTETGKPKVSEETLEDIDCPFVRDYVEYMSLQKVLTTSLGGIQDRLDSEGYLHPSFSLNTVQTYRSSSANPNFQNFPNRNKRLSELVRRCFIPRSPDRHFVEIDFSGSEVRCLSGDTKIATIDGDECISDVVERVQRNDTVYVYAWDFDKSRIGISRVVGGLQTGQRVDVWEVVLDNGESVRATKNHQFMMRDGSYLRLDELHVGDSLMPLYRSVQKACKTSPSKYLKVFTNSGGFMLAHRIDRKSVV
jgi:hypothetical protein